jgi:IclR family pca regulon transcriptional regulator
MDQTLPAEDSPRDRDHIAGLVKGLRLIEAFDSAHTRMTLSEAARRVGITPASARRCLLTLCEIGYAQTDGKLFWLSHGALRIAYAYAASTRLPRLLQPALDALSERTRESATLCVLDGDGVVIAARSSARRTMRVGLGVGSRLPLYCSAAGRALIATMPRERWQKLVLAAPMLALTENTVVTLDGLERLLRECRDKGYFTCDEEIELGVRSIAIPLFDKTGDTVAAMSISTRAERLTTGDMVRQLLPTMLRHQEWARARLG